MNGSESLFDRAEEAAEFVRGAIGNTPRIAVVLGSGLGELTQRVANRAVVPYSAIPHFPVPTVAGHQGNLVVGEIDGVEVLYFQGRFHFYEGHDLTTTTFPVRVCARLGVTTLILTAATGGINLRLRPGDVICLSDHLNLIGQNPLRGRNEERFGPRFPDMTEVYSRRLRDLAIEAAAGLGMTLHSGVYACLPGPSYETPAEIQMLRTLGADVVGMSTVPEAVVARHCGIEVLAFALVTNAAAGVTGAVIHHDEVLEAGRQAIPRLGGLIEGVAKRLGGAG